MLFVIIKKSLILNKLDIPQDMIEILKSFLFFDIKMLFKRSITEINECLSRYNFRYTSMTDYNEHWAIGNNHTQLQGVNCKLCGGYIMGHQIDNKYLKCYHFDH